MGLRQTAENFVHDLSLPKPPFWMVSLALVLVTLSWVPIALIARARVTPSAQPRVHLFQDMDSQPKLKPQDYTTLFRDHRAMRPPVTGTVARGELNEDDLFVNGFTITPADGPEGKPVAEYVPQIPVNLKVDEAFVKRGQSRFNIYCAPCHGFAGHGDGPINKRAARLQGNQQATLGTVWAPAPSLHVVDEATGQLKYGPGQYADGKLFSVIGNGLNNMAGYAEQIEVEDRWAIVAYVRALQVSQHAPENLLSAEAREKLTSGTN